MDRPVNESAKADASSPVGVSDAALIARALSGERVAFDELIRRHQRQAMAVSFRLLGNINDALEVTQDAFLKAYRSLPTLQNPAAFGGWLMRIVSNLSLNYRRGRKVRKSQLPLDDLLGSSTEGGDATGGSEWMSRDQDPSRALAGRELGAALKEALRQLPDKQREAILLFAVQQLPQKEVAEILGCSVEAVKWHVFQGRKKLKELLKDVM
jgi:RNA polymerase sigma-70 factor (ECF subfamily)